jgi:hypothetical protein
LSLEEKRDLGTGDRKREHLKVPKKTVVGASRSLGRSLSSETSDAPHRLRKPTTYLQKWNAPRKNRMFNFVSFYVKLNISKEAAPRKR